MARQSRRHISLDRLDVEANRREAPPRERVHLGPVYVLLILIVVLATVVSIVWSDVAILERFGPNIATESLGILLTVVVVRRFMEQAERSRRLRASVGAVRKARRPLQDLVDTWATTLKGCLAAREHTEFTSMQQLCSPENSELLLWCDPTAPRQGGNGECWVRWVARRIAEAQAQLDQIIATYAGTLEPEYVEAIDTLTADPFLRGFADLTETDIGPQPWRVALNTVRALRMAHFDRLLRTVALHNRLAADVAGVRGRAAAPRTSTLGVELPPDYDLKIETDLDEGWWRSWPGIGALRMPDPVRRTSHEAASGGQSGA